MPLPSITGILLLILLNGKWKELVLFSHKQIHPHMATMSSGGRGVVLAEIM